ncbi:hypothetical protein [Paenibacillus dakarensis]|uniref:hypothetical protein n=1 Tax=Paenibacillus dakarensis TaxID=1527293 RepID=UPI000B2137F4|nr:hypothetical protein [Paenibacillus dakarensis]
MSHFTIIKKETGEEVGCTNGPLPQKVLDTLGVELKASDAEYCSDCNEDLEG